MLQPGRRTQQTTPETRSAVRAHGSLFSSQISGLDKIPTSNPSPGTSQAIAGVNSASGDAAKGKPGGSGAPCAVQRALHGPGPHTAPAKRFREPRTLPGIPGSERGWSSRAAAQTPPPARPRTGEPGPAPPQGTAPLSPRDRNEGQQGRHDTAHATIFQPYLAAENPHGLGSGSSSLLINAHRRAPTPSSGAHAGAEGNGDGAGWPRPQHADHAPCG